VPFLTASDALGEFRGVGRRFEVRGEARCDDYRRLRPSSTEIKSTLAGARLRYPGQPIWAVLQPHTYSRTKTLLNEFAAAFEDADHVIITAIYASRERTRWVSAIAMWWTAMLQREVPYPDVLAIDTLDEVVQYLRSQAQPGDVVITFSAGDANRISTDLLK